MLTYLGPFSLCPACVRFVSHLEISLSLDIQNRLLFEGVTDRLHALEYDVLSSQLFPANDGGVSLGQATIAVAKGARD